ncbi:uncharacterized protein [Misgurnus anguillicaudatus]|uniref:uncharacterized protein isoform X3 n=1 Tax=Misgurnus anguillicaudatus TaxID=75329 RepID=UPI003CCF77E8
MASFIKSEEQRSDFYKIWAYENLQFNQRVRMKLQTDLQSQQQNHRLSRAAWLQARWLEISEQEHRARLHNQKLLLDFQRAQDTLDDMVARTKAMNTLRVQYERYLKESFPRWKQKLKDMHVSEQSKQMEEDQDIKADITSHPVTSKSPYQSQFPSQTLLNIHQIGKDIRQNAAKCKQDHQYPPATWLTEPQPFISGLQQNNIPKDYKNLHNIKALNHHFTISSPSDSHHQSHSPVQQKPPSIDQTWQNPWVGVRQGLIPTGHFTPAGASWPRLPVINPVPWGMMDVPDSGGEKIQCSETDQGNPTKEMLNPPKESKQRLKHRRRGGECDQLSELDCRPVQLLKDHKASVDSSMSFEVDKVLACGMKHRRKKRRDRTQSHLAANEQESQCSSTVSQNALLSASGGQTDPKRRVNHQKPSAGAKMDTSKESINAETDVDGVIQDEEEKEESWDQEKPLSSDKTDGTEELNQKHSTEEEDTDEGDNIDLISEDKISDRKVADESEEEEGSEDEEEAGLDEAQGSEEEGSESVVRNRDDLSDGEEREKEGDISSNIPDSDSEDGGEKTEEEIEENSSQDELIKGTQGRKDQDESEEEESDKIVHVQIHNNSLMMMKMKELQTADETEEEEVYNQEIEEDDDENDETVFKQAYLWSKHTLYDQPKCHDDDDDDNEDIEIVLKPQVNSQIHPEDDVEKTKQPNDLPSDSSEDDTPKKTKNESAESDDEFDHFYD